MIYNVSSPEETEALGKRLGEEILRRGITRAFIAMRGEMGVGKTVFCRGFASAFSISGVRSPTYTVVNEYRGEHPVFHFDLYRISDEDDLISVGYDDYVMRDGYSIVEWSERIPDEIPDDAIYVSIWRVEGDDALRKIEITGIAV